MKKFNILLGKYQEFEDKKKSKNPEAQVAKEVDLFLKSIRAYCRQINSGGTMRNGRWTTSGQGKGISDRIGLLQGGRFIAIELKAQGKKQTVTPAQVDFLLKIINNGGIGCVADSVEDVKKALIASPSELESTVKSYLKEKTHQTNSLELWEEMR